jgi:DNA-binding transcriptional LysR family regulator
MRGEPESLSGRFRFGASHFLASRTLLNAWQGLKNKHRDVIADIYSMNTSHAIAEVISGRLDLAVCFSPMTHSSLKEIKLLEGELVVVVRKNHPILRRPAGDRLRFLAEGSAVIHKSNQGAESCESHPIFEAMGFQPKIEMYFDDDETAIRRVISSESWTFVPDIVAKEYAKDVKVIRLPAKFGKATYHVSAIARRERANERWLQELF